MIFKSLKYKYINESDFRQKIALKKQIEILEEQKQKMIEAFHDEMSALEEEVVNMQREFVDTGKTKITGRDDG